MLHTIGIRFLVATEYHAHALVELEALVHKCFDCVHRDDDRPFVVNRSAPPNLVVYEFARIGGVLPAVTLGNDVQVPDDAYDVFAFADFRISAVSVKVHRTKTEIFCHAQYVLQTIFVALSERTSRDGRIFNRLYAHGILYCVYDARHISFNIHICLR